MHIAHVHVHVKPGMEDEFVDACVANAASSVLEPDNLRFDVLRSGAFYHLDQLALVPIRPRRRRELHSLRTLSPSRRLFLSAHHPSLLSIPTHAPRCLSTPPLTPFNSTPTFVASYGRSPSEEDPTRFVLIEIYATAEGPAAHKKTPHYAEWRKTVEDMMASPRSARTFRPVFPTEVDEWKMSLWA